MILRGLLLGSLLLLAGCTHVVTSTCADGGDAMVRLQCRAGSGDKLAQLDLGRRYEAGDGVTVDLKKAVHLYRLAAQSISGTTYVYSPPVGKRGRGTVLPIRTGVDRPGLGEAKYRLGLMYRDGRGVRQDEAKASRLISEAQSQGYRPVP